MTTKHQLPRTPAGKDDVYLPMRDTTHLLEKIISDVENIQPVGQLGRLARTDVDEKLNEVIRCLNKLVSVVGGK